MKNIRRALRVLAILTVIFVVTVQTAAANEIGSVTTIWVSNASARQGEEVNIPVNLKQNPGIAGFTVTLEFDAAKLQPIEFIEGAFAGAISDMTQQGGSTNPNRIIVTAASAQNNVTADLHLFTVRFKLLAAESNPIPIKILQSELRNQTYQTITHSTSDGSVNGTGSRSSVVYGDINQDGQINISDLVLFMQYLAGWSIPMTPLEVIAMDVDFDGYLTAADAVKLSQYLAGWQNVVLGPQGGSDGKGQPLSDTPKVAAMSVQKPQADSDSPAVVSDTVNVASCVEFY